MNRTYVFQMIAVISYVRLWTSTALKFVPNYSQAIFVALNQLLQVHKSLAEVLTFASTNPQYDDRLFIELQIQYMKSPSSEHEENMLCTKIVFDIQNNLCTQHVLPMFFKKKSF